MNVRKELGFRTVFNLLGPLSNPGFINKQIVGVYSKELLLPFAKALKKLGSTNAWVVHGKDGLDEVSTTGITYCAQLKNGKIEEMTLNPIDFGIPKSNLRDLAGGTPTENAMEIIELLQGKKGSFFDIVVFNSASALVATGLQDNLNDGIKEATLSIESGNAKDKLNQLIKLSNK